ncbi:Uma2 family endonuclease [Paenibacillus cremeus]|uniref:Uma2 family endonuclease n=1 Tax=Paenibacillus cremeus TaxID=2163881 RepID=A0A559K905_9BACL|nr:Uma2 family endonuclease [Paenibacillus cremeus]TVY08604.1 Uma2 family endonuclease [Paenibacillus cremeus]
MCMPEPAKRYKYRDTLDWEGRLELIDGLAFNMTAAPSTGHQRAVVNLLVELHTYLKGSSCEAFVAPFELRLSESEEYDNPDTVCQPDISVICNPSQLDEKGCKGAPKLVIEVLSPSTAIKDRNEKFKIYQRYGVEEYWIVDPVNQTIEVYGLEKGVYAKREVFGKESELHFRFPRASDRITGDTRLISRHPLPTTNP